MGGLYSGNFRDKKVTVEKCLCLDVNDLSRKGLLRGKFARDRISWMSESGEEIHRVELEVMLERHGMKHLGITHCPTEFKPLALYYQPVYLESTRLPSGGKRWWFICPGADGLNRSEKREDKASRKQGIKTVENYLQRPPWGSPHPIAIESYVAC